MDARIVRTRRRLQEALYELARERGLDEISVSDIAERAGVNRSTFYQHYSDKETLLADALDLVIHEARAELVNIDPWSEEPPAAIMRFLEHVDDNAELYKRVFTEAGFGAVIARLRSRVADAIQAAAARPDASMPADLPIEIAAAGFTGSFIGVLAAWLQQDPRPKVDIAAEWIWFVLTGAHRQANEVRGALVEQYPAPLAEQSR